MENVEQISLAYMIRNTRTRINAPAAAIWPFLLRFESFNQTFEKVEVLSGTLDTVGSVCLLTKQEGEWYMPPYLVKILLIEAEKQIVWKMLPHQGDSYTAFVDFSLAPDGEGAIFTSNVYTEAKIPRVGDAELREIERQMAENYDKLESYIFPILKNLAEDAVRQA